MLPIDFNNKISYSPLYTQASNNNDEDLADKYPDLKIQSTDPSPARKSHDKIATNSDKLHPSEQVISLFLSNKKIESESDENQYQLCHKELSTIMTSAYEKSLTFRRLFNYAYDTNLCDGDKWYLSTQDAFSTTVTAEEIKAENGKKIISLTTDPANCSQFNEDYQQENGNYALFSLIRAFMHEIVHALTMLPDEDNNHARGAVVEYTNIILKEMGNKEPARFKY
ncbi:PipA/GogA/GtgA family type III secretion system effector [Arsenophonus nasoniae]|uniref:Pathogenicity island-encoded protein A n=1 Tax=Arsenophonus nasoniae TaxID=638 RepID=D2U1A1_9GAMM|nr:PipA/GogA/GtgA family type III secretion system effector [Arsenophonus nasoniae]QBY45228.1 PipA protein [Arsenophonus nasoniae]WGM05411.1 PipA/GogA/GtgA family type III secretion system effector [Arsenophonus nasoniae]WGM10419.1 PipA/GogA/GtgA family type III secretion system effector [Arsenophonus nasoniae]WGM15130.1 PipA/GogA/GtgA family type III secretion system effector [Arsenophonus nasoniae]CBA74469.1 pathogenicity island-encoded protein A [Arsenophonus nasoniae]